MLAQSFLSPEELQLTTTEHEALVKVLGMLEREEIPALLFDMENVGEPECGTSGCILGWARSLSPRPINGRLFDTWCAHPVHNVFAPDGGDMGNPYYATRSQAATALRNFLTTGHPRWDEAMSTNTYPHYGSGVAATMSWSDEEKQKAAKP